MFCLCAGMYDTNDSVEAFETKLNLVTATLKEISSDYVSTEQHAGKYKRNPSQEESFDWKLISD